MEKLWLYRSLSKWRLLNYRGKIMLTAFVGTHVPLIAIIALFAIWSAPSWRDAAVTVGVALVATLAGTGVTLFVLNHLLRPILMTAAALREYMKSRALPSLPTFYTDEAGRLMADASTTVTRLDALIDTLEHFDAVTGLRNREGFVRALNQCFVEGADRLALAVIRMRGFSRLISTFGQDLGNQVATELAARLTKASGDQAHITARVGSDTFALVMKDDGSPDRVADALERIREEAAAEIISGQMRTSPDLIAAIAVYPFDGGSAEELLNAAMVAIGEAERSPTRQVTFFSNATREAAQERFRLEQDLRTGISDGQLALHYQPIVDMSIRRVIGAEALLRWKHPSLGMVPPMRFVPLAESAGLMGELGLWVLREACEEARRWRSDGLSALKVAVNLSARQFADEHIVRSIGDVLAASGVPGGSLDIELTETAAMSDVQRTRRIFGALREMGISISIDDFGTGYSSMSYLKNLPFDTLKIDREFVTDVDTKHDSAAICRALIELAHGLGLHVLAEGAENEEEVRTLMQQGCTTFQGYYFAKPMPAADFRARVADPTWQGLFARAA